MRTKLLIAAALLASSAAIAQTDSGPTPNVAASLTVQPAGDVGIRPDPNNKAPVLQAITYRVNVLVGNVLFDIVPDFHFTAPNGNAIVLHRDLVDTNGPRGQDSLLNATINTPSAAQKKGAVLSGGWRCGGQVYYIKMRATILDADGNRSNPVTYTIHCNGG